MLCGNRVRDFLPHGKGEKGRSPLSRALKVVGSDVENMECPRCGATDRERHLLLYLEAAGLRKRFRGARILHMAPEKKLGPIFRNSGAAWYLAADIAASPRVDLRFDLAQMPFTDASFDVIVANHVLEHVARFEAGLAELSRVLTPGGLAILQTPYSPLLHGTFEDPGVSSDDARFHAYGQEDHVRLFGRNIVELIEGAGFRSRVAVHAQMLPEVSAYEVGVNADEPFFLFEKRQISS